MTNTSQIINAAKPSRLPKEVIWQGRPSLVLAYPKLGLFFISTIALIWYLLSDFQPHSLVYKVYFVLVAISLTRFCIESIKLKTIVYTLTESRLLVKSGILKRITDEVELFRVRDFRLEEPLALRPFKLGNLIVVTSDRTTPIVTLKAIPELNKLHEVLREHVKQCWFVRGVREIDAG